MQIKKKFFSLLLSLICVLAINQKIYAQNDTIEENQSEVVESIIEEPNINEFKPYVFIINTLTSEEKELICRITWQEAGNQSIKGQRAVIEVILNRLLSDQYPNTILEILSQPNQFSTWKDRNKVTEEQILQMQQVLNLVYVDKNTILNYDYLYFNCKKPNKDGYIKIQNQWFWI